MSKSKKRSWIVAPHPDDELIGCFSALEAGLISGVAYFDFGNDVRRNEAEVLCTSYQVELINLENNLSHLLSFVSETTNDYLYLPSPEDDHQLHKAIFQVSIHVRRMAVKPTTVYSVYMNDWFIKESTDPVSKRRQLDFFYPSQKSLWASDHKFFLFEGMAQV